MHLTTRQDTSKNSKFLARNICHDKKYRHFEGTFINGSGAQQQFFDDSTPSKNQQMTGENHAYGLEKGRNKSS